MTTGGAATGGKSSGNGGAGTGGAGNPATGGQATGGKSAGTGGASTGGSAGGGSTGDVVKSEGCGTTGWPTTKEGYSISVNGTNRTYNLRIPDNYDNNHAYRLIVSYHWLNGTANNVSQGSLAKPYYGLWDLAQGSTIFVAPQGINNGWSDTGRTNSAGGQDIKFTTALLTELTSKLCIDKSRIFAEGFSMGGSMSYAVACALPDVFRGVAAHSGGPMSGCVTHSKPVAYFMTHGTQDNVCTYPAYGVPQLNDFAKLNGCMTQTLPTPTSSASACVDFPGCMPGYPARACLFVGSHTPSPPNANSSWVPAETWKFISQF